jgi:hypothetical protein
LTTLHKFENDLLALIGQPTDLRPFVCDGSPLHCDVFIVGLNPASPMQADFWDFWRNGAGFDRNNWFDVYRQERATRPLKPGKTRRPAISNSRRTIDWVVAEAGTGRCLETNIYATSTEEYRDLAQAQRSTAPFDFLLATISPAVIVVHGKDAIAHLRHKQPGATVIEVAHFSRGWSEAAARELGRRVRTALDNAASRAA